MMVVSRYPVSSSDPARLRDAVDRWLGEPVFRTLATPQRSGSTSSLPLDVFATEQDVYVIAAVPGLGPDELEVTVEDNVITLSGNLPNVARSVEGDPATWFLHELNSGQFKRTITLAVDVDFDRADARVDNGVLRLRLPKAEAARPRQIKVQAVASQAAAPEIAETAAAE